VDRKRIIIAAALALAGIAALADTSVGPDTYTSQALRRGTTTVATVNPSTPDACHARAQTDAEARHATATYTCGSLSFVVTYTAAPIVCAPTAPADTSKTISCQSPYFGTRQVTQGWTLQPSPTCWVNDGPINPPTDSAPPCTTTPPAGYSTSFPLAENPINEGGMWRNGAVFTGGAWNNVKTLAGKGAVGDIMMQPNNRYSDNIATLTTSFTANQYAQGTVYRAAGYNGNGGNHEIELLLRFNINGYADAKGYEVLWGLAGYIAIARWNGGIGQYTALYDPGVGSIPPPQDGDVLRAEISGNVIKVFRNGVQVATATDSTFTSGQPGVGFWPVDGADPNSLGWRNYSAGPLQ
jgi:hypothetical protein